MGKLGELVTRKFEWRQEHSEAFEELKNMLSSDTVHAYFDTHVQHKLYTDGCPVGLAAALTQRKPGEQCWRVCQSEPHRPGETVQPDWIRSFGR